MKKLLCTLALCVSLTPMHAGNIVRMSEFGVLPDSHCDIFAAADKALQKCRSLDGPVTILFDKGTYHIDYDGIDGSESSVDRTLFRIRSAENITIDGGGSLFLFSGIGGFASVIESKNITLRNFSIDWPRPFITQSSVIEAEDDHLTLGIDKQKYPYVIKDKRIRFIFPSGEYGIARDSYNNFFTPQGRILPGTADNYNLCPLLEGDVAEISEGVLRFDSPNPVRVPPGTIMTIYNVRYKTPWCILTKSDNILLKDIVIHHTVGCGVVATLVKDLVIDNVDYLPSEGRVFTGVADAFHITNCYGNFVLRNCEVDGQGDDALNVHGRYFKLAGINHSRTRAKVSFSHGIPLSFPGDYLWLVNRQTMCREDTLEVVKFKQLGNDKFRIAFDHQIKEGILNEDIHFESATLFPDVLVENNVFGNSNRARGILLTSPGKMLVRNNVFRSAGCAILVEGDLTYWYESGGVRDLTITDNVFDNCHISPWGNAIISLTPSPEPAEKTSQEYHKNVLIENNTFITDQKELIYYRMVSDLVFRNNEVLRRNFAE